jgi:nitrate reductase gamma subunit
MPGQSDAGYIGKLSRLLWNIIHTIFSSKIVSIIKAIILDVLLQRRLYRQSGIRWLIHSLIFFPFVFRFFWGLIALITSLWAPECPVAWSMLDKNHSTTALVFDMTGIMVLLGAGLAFIRGLMKRSHQIPGLPKQDRVALGMIAVIIIIGFVLEGMRMAMTSPPIGSSYAFVGYGISKLFSGFSGLPEIYGYIWYIHAILTGIFVAYLPFSRLFHLIVGPVVLIMNAVSEHGRR